MKITTTTLSLTVQDPAASATFLVEHLGFTQDMAADGFASLSRTDAGANVVLLRRGIEVLPEDQRDVLATGLILAFTVEDLEGELARLQARLQAEGVAITMPMVAEEWGEQAFQVRDPNGVVLQLVDWNGPTPQTSP